jgi:hypothetical protein
MLKICGLLRKYGKGSLVAFLLIGYLEKPDFMKGWTMSIC